MRFETIPY
ncbi:hypothetical protein LINGRAHAP2_LOCUS22372 [Linum grandiflorum]